MYKIIYKVMSVVICIFILMTTTIMCTATNSVSTQQEASTIEQPQKQISEDEIRNLLMEIRQLIMSLKEEKGVEVIAPAEEITAPAANEDNSIKISSTSLGQFKITAYCNCTKCCGKWAGGPTASGTMPQAGRTIAVDPKVIPLGSQVIIDGHTYVAEDTGGAIKGNKIDMYFASHSEALAWGVKYKEVSLVN